MENIRIGNSVHVSWRLYNNNGSQYVLSGKVRRLWIISAALEKEISSYGIQGRNELVFSIPADDLIRYGTYKIRLTIRESESGTEDATYELTQVFQVVSQSYPNASGAVSGVVELPFTTVLNNVVVERIEGLSAYEIAVNNGYEGTEQEWVVEYNNALDAATTAAADASAAITAFNANEQARIEVENERVAAEQARVLAEAGRVSAESTRVSNESGRVAAEEARVSAEAGRVTAENGRVDAESSRVSAESSRVSAESSRVSAESARATRSASDHTRAENDHSLAVSDHSTASSDHTTAANDHTTASADHNRAESDHTLAATDHTTAEADHTTAGSDHTTAGSDHTTAGSDHTRAGEDHTLAAADHVTAEADHATWAGYRVVVKSVGETAPASPSSGDKWYKTTDNKIYSYSGSSWDSGVAATTGATIVNSVTNDVYVFNGASLFNNEAEVNQLRSEVGGFTPALHKGNINNTSGTIITAYPQYCHSDIIDGPFTIKVKSGYYIYNIWQFTNPTDTVGATRIVADTTKTLVEYSVQSTGYYRATIQKTDTSNFAFDSSNNVTEDVLLLPKYGGLANTKQDTLIPGQNIKNVNGISIIGSGNLLTYSQEMKPKAKIRPNLHATLPAIAFNIDMGVTATDFDYAEQSAVLFEKYGLSLGFCVKCESTISNPALPFGIWDKYKEWQNRGHDIINHGERSKDYRTGSQNITTYAEAVASILDCENALQKHGLISNGWCSPNSAINPDYIPILNSLYAYAFTNYEVGKECTRDANPIYLTRTGFDSLTVQQVKDTIDSYISQNKLLVLYYHANNVDGVNYPNLTMANIELIIQYAMSKRQNQTAYVSGTDDAIRSFFDI